MKKFNLSDWALNHASLLWYFMIVFVIAGVFSYFNLGREEDPPFTIKTMIVQAQWPGASAEETARQVTDRIERKLEELDTLDFTRSMTTAGRSIVFVNLQSNVKGDGVPATWLRIRNMIGDIKSEFPAGTIGPFFDDRFGDVYGNVYAFTGDGFSQRQLRDYVEAARASILTVPNIGRVEVAGAQDEVIYLEFSTRQIAALGLDQQSIIATLQAQNAIAPSGVMQAGPERISIRVGGHFTSEESLRSINLRVNGRFFPLNDVANITRGYADPPSSLFRFNGEPAIGLAISMKAGANLLEFGDALEGTMRKISAEFPAGIGIHKVSDQPAVVDKAVSGFTLALAEAIAIVLVISFISLGLRAGLVVAISIPMVLAITFFAMYYWGISLQRVSLGALIIALGLLVDDAMIAVEMMVARLEIGDTLRKAATHVYTSTAFPMLTGTLVTVAGFMPIGLNDSMAGQFAFSLFAVIAVSLIVSWVVAVLFTPLLGISILPATMKKHRDEKGRFPVAFSRILAVCLRWRWVTIAATLTMLAAAAVSMAFVQIQLFPASDRPELIVDWNLPQNSTIVATSAQMAKFEREALKDNPGIEYWSTYVGQGAMRFLLTLDPPAPDVSIGQTVIVTKSLEVRDQVRTELQKYLDENFISTDTDIKLLEIGPPIGYPIQYRVAGPDIQTVRSLAQDLAGVLRGNLNLGKVTFDWREPARVVRINLLQDKARQLGVTSRDISSVLNGVVDGTTITQVRDDIYLVNAVARARSDERGSLETLQSLQLPGSDGQSIPLASIATFHYELEQPVIWRRSRIPTITVRANTPGSVKAMTIVSQLQKEITVFEAKLPAGYSITTGGEMEESIKTLMPVISVVPLMLLVMATILMIQLQSFHRLFLVFAVGPLAIIGVAIALVPTGVPLGFIAGLGILSLAGILIRNSVILVVQIETLRKAGKAPWDAVVEATEQRMRPIVITAAAASVALIPISREVFWGPMAYAMMGGIILGTALTLLFLPALYVAWFRIEKPMTVALEREPDTVDWENAPNNDPSAKIT